MQGVKRQVCLAPFRSNPYFLGRMTDWETAPAVTETPDIKLFGKWSTDDVQINDISLQVFFGLLGATPWGHPPNPVERQGGA